MTAKRTLLLVTLVAGGLMVLGWSQTWFGLTLGDGRDILVDGSAAAGGVLASGLAALAVAAALTIAPPVLRFVLGALGLVVGAIATAVAVVAIADPIGASLATVTTETGVAGRDSVAALVARIATTPWPWVSVAGGILAVFAGAAVLATARRWPAATARYERSGAKRDDWDVLSEGDDPTTAS